MIIAITIAALILRLILSGQSFWLDQGASYVLSSLPLPQFFQAIKADFHPPLYYLLLHLYLPYVTSESLIRLPGIIIGTLTVPLTYELIKNLPFTKAGRLAANRYPIALLSALIVAINPLHVYYSQELRMYSLNTFLTAASWLYLIKLQKNQTLSNIFTLTLINLLNLYTFYGTFFIIAAQAVYLFFYQKKR